jgi:hypothetical protein
MRGDQKNLLMEKYSELNPRLAQIQRLERLTVNAPVATVLGLIPASIGTVESVGLQMKQC